MGRLVVPVKLFGLVTTFWEFNHGNLFAQIHWLQWDDQDQDIPRKGLHLISQQRPPSNVVVVLFSFLVTLLLLPLLDLY